MTIREKLETVKTNKKYRTFILIKNKNNEKLELVPLTFQSMIKDKLDQEFISFKKEIEHYTKETVRTDSSVRRNTLFHETCHKRNIKKETCEMFSYDLFS